MVGVILAAERIFEDPFKQMLAESIVYAGLIVGGAVVLGLLVALGLWLFYYRGHPERIRPAGDDLGPR